MKKRTDKLTILIIIFAVIVALLAIVLKVLPALSGGSRGKTITEKLKSGQKYLSEMDYDQAIAAFNEALEIDDRNTEAYVGLGDAYTGKEDWTPAVTNYDEAIETVAEQAPVDAVSADEIAAVRDTHTEITYAEEDEWALMAALEDNEDLEIPGILIDTIDADYVEDIIIKRNNALYEGVQIFLLPEAESNDYHAWLEVVMHPEYVPEEVAPKVPVPEEPIPSADVKTNTKEIFDDQIVDLINEEEVIPEEDRSWELEINDSNEFINVPDEFNRNDSGILLTDLYDYDGDKELELLVFRKEPGKESVPIWNGNHNFDRDVYYLEMYEIENDSCIKVASRKLGIFGNFDPFSFNNQALLVFRHTTQEGTDICLETYLSETDHSGDDEILMFRYADGQFSGDRGIRCGYFQAGEYSAQYLTCQSAEAYEYLCCRDNTFGWKLVTAEQNAFDRFDEGLKDLGFTMFRRRNEKLDEKLWKDEKAHVELYTMTITEHIAPIEGEITELYQMFLYSEHWKNGSYASGENSWHYKRIREDVTDYLQMLMEERKEEIQPKNRENNITDPNAQSGEKGSDSGTPQTLTSLPDSVPSNFIFSSGAGGWATDITLEKDGSFDAHFKDTEFGAGEVYYCDFTGKFTNIRQLNAYSYSMELGELNVQTEQGNSFEKDGMTWIGSEPSGFNDGGKEYILYLPETPVSELNETFLSWVNPIHTVTGDQLGCVAIYDASGEKHYGFVGR